MVALYGRRTISNGASLTFDVIRYSTLDCGATMAVSAVSVWTNVGGFPKIAVSTSAFANLEKRSPMLANVGVKVVDGAPVDPNAWSDAKMPVLLNSRPLNLSLQFSPRQMASTSVIPKASD